MNNDISDDDIRVIGRKPKTDNSGKRRTALLVGILVLIAAIVVVLILLLRQNGADAEIVQQDVDNKEESIPVEGSGDIATGQPTADTADFRCIDTIIEGVKIRIFESGNTAVSLAMFNEIDTNPTDVVFATQAANIRADNHNVIGDFVINGEVKVKGCPNDMYRGFCALLADKLIIGKAEKTTFLDSAIIKNGSFYRHCAYVTGGAPEQFDDPKEAIRRALCLKGGKVLVVESVDIVTSSNFAQILHRLNVDNAVGLMGGKNLDEWYRTDSSRTVLYQNPYEPNLNRNYLIFRKK